MMLFTSYGKVFALTNPDYTPEISVSEGALDSKIKSSVLLDTLASMINAVASLAEYLIGAVFQSLTGEDIFPWADRIIFNGIGFLDINFINPSNNSLFVKDGKDSVLGEVVKKVYSTIFSLAVLFLGVAVGIMAIRLAISSIASEKARYKQSIVNWLTCIVMLFMMHYILAFVFWINEQMVRIASNILISTIDDKVKTVDFSEALSGVLKADDRVKLYLESMDSFANNFNSKFLTKFNSDKTIGANAETVVKNNSEIANSLLSKTSYLDERLVYYADNCQNAWDEYASTVGNVREMAYMVGLPRLANDVEDAAAIKTTYDGYVKRNDIKGFYKKIKNDGYITGKGTHKIYYTEEAYKNSDDYTTDLRWLAYSRKANNMLLMTLYLTVPSCKVVNENNPNYLSTIFLSGIPDFDAPSVLTKSKSELENSVSKAAIQEMVNTRLKVDGFVISAATGNEASSTTDIIANLGNFFKQSAYVYTTKAKTTDDAGEETVVTGWRASKVSVTGALLYAIFIFQSMMYLITYVKRLFYVIMLSMFGPIVVIYDFFIKSAT